MTIQINYDADVMGRAKAMLAKIDHPAWVRFFVGLAGLALALVAAMSSTVFRDRDRGVRGVVAGRVCGAVYGSISGEARGAGRVSRGDRL
jgi:hypothetical protein